MEKPFTAYQGDEPYIFVSYAHVDAPVVYEELIWLREQGFTVERVNFVSHVTGIRVPID